MFNQERSGEGRLVLGSTVKRESLLLAILSLLLVFSVAVQPSFADGRVFISGINPPSAYPYSRVHVYGGGATPKQAVIAKLGGPVSPFIIAKNETYPFVILGSSNITLASTLANESGEWGIDFVTPNVYPGVYSVFVVDKESLTSDIVSFQVQMNVTFAPLTNVTSAPLNVTIGPLQMLIAGNAQPSSGPPGTFVTVSGSSASGGEIQVYFDDLHVATVVGQHLGDWGASFQVPNVSSGLHTIRALDVGARWMYESPFTVISSQSSIFPKMSLLVLGLFAVGVFSGIVTIALLFIFSMKKKRNTTE
jgi:hypothetical protein